MSILAVVRDGIVENLTVAGEEPWTPPEGTTAVPVPEGTFVDIGWSYDTTSEQFAPPAE